MVHVLSELREELKRKGNEADSHACDLEAAREMERACRLVVGQSPATPQAERTDALGSELPSPRESDERVLDGAEQLGVGVPDGEPEILREPEQLLYRLAQSTASNNHEAVDDHLCPHTSTHVSNDSEKGDPTNAIDFQKPNLIRRIGRRMLAQMQMLKLQAIVLVACLFILGLPHLLVPLGEWYSKLPRPAHAVSVGALPEILMGWLGQSDMAYTLATFDSIGGSAKRSDGVASLPKKDLHKISLFVSVCDSFLKRTHSSAPFTHMALSSAAFDVKRLDLSRSSMDSVLSEFPHSIVTHFLYASSLTTLGDYSAARREYELGLQGLGSTSFFSSLLPDESSYRRSASTFYRLIGEPENALRCLQLPVTSKPSSALSLEALYLEKADVLADMHKYDQAIACCNFVINTGQTDYDRSRGHRQRGSIYLCTGDLARAESELAFTTNDSFLRFQIAKKKGDLKLALRLANDWLKSDPSCDWYYLRRASVLHLMKRNTEALADCESAESFSGLFGWLVNFDVHALKGRIFLDIHKYKEALQEAEFLLKINPHFAPAYKIGMAASVGLHNPNQAAEYERRMQSQSNKLNDSVFESIE